ncbi:helix-turn-helix domain-containing protein [uncultured Tenacibaculum sp.]|uniref:winged helix-turn-helix transcriptional regulator n=1 Tax=uncultured Tenacibaculum sp. TaxID=174713 RepID=UPI00260F9CE6|nr:helix-turn-helix domain-containing protein [uncultured Tenacibaculum sp.]
MGNTFRSNCPITSALDIVGDKWSLVIIKQMLFEGKSTFKDFTESTEAIATNILSSRLKMLEEYGILSKTKLPANKKTNIYFLTDKGLGLTPTLMELTFWSKDYMQEFHPSLNLDKQLDTAQKNKDESYKRIVENYKNWLEDYK